MLSFFVASATQGSADAFVQAQITTGLQNVQNLAFRIRRIEFQFPALIGTADNIIQMSLSRKSLSAMPVMTDRSVIRLQNRVLELTTSGMVVYETVSEQTFDKDEDLVIVEDPLYFQLDSNATGVANTAYVRIGYETRKISETERLSIIAASLVT